MRTSARHCSRLTSRHSRHKADSDGTVTITPDDGYRIAKILVNGKEVDIENKLTGLKSTDEVVVTFEKIEETTKPTVSFTDVQSTDWYAEAVTYAVENGLFQGTSATTFEPNANMNRAMLVTVLYRMSGEQAKADTAFGDVAQNAWYAEAVAWAKTNGIVSGVSATQFAPNQNVTRGWQQSCTATHSIRVRRPVTRTQTLQRLPMQIPCRATLSRQ